MEQREGARQVLRGSASSSSFEKWLDHPDYRRMSGGRNRSKGYTLVELMVAIAILATLGSIAGISYSRYIDNVRRLETVTQIRRMEREIKIYEIMYGHLPPTLAEVALDRERDQWGNLYRYLRIEDSDDAKGKNKGKGKQRRDRWLNPVNTDYDLYSMGPDGRTQVEFNAHFARDDIVRANNGDYVGLASEY